MKRPLAVATLSTFLSASALCAETTPLPFTYEAFEAGVTHVDLAQCPEALAAEGRFCRATVVNDNINVFAFSEDGDQPMVGFKSWPADLMNGLMD